MKVLVTGGGGFIGSHLVERLLDEGHEVRVLDNFATGRRENLARRARRRSSSSRATSRATSASTTPFAAARSCFHQAALPSVPRSIQDPLTSNAVNVTGTLNVLLAARDAGVRRVVFASSSSVYGREPGAAEARGHAAAADLALRGRRSSRARATAAAFSEVYGLETVALRYFNVFGPRQDPLSQYAAVIPQLHHGVASTARPDGLRRRRADPRLHLRGQRRPGERPRR